MSVDNIHNIQYTYRGGCLLLSSLSPELSKGIPDAEWWRDPAALLPAPLLVDATPGAPGSQVGAEAGAEAGRFIEAAFATEKCMFVVSVSVWVGWVAGCVRACVRPQLRPRLGVRARVFFVCFLFVRGFVLRAVFSGGWFQGKHVVLLPAACCPFTDIEPSQVSNV